MTLEERESQDLLALRPMQMYFEKEAEAARLNYEAELEKEKNQQ